MGEIEHLKVMVCKPKQALVIALVLSLAISLAVGVQYAAAQNDNEAADIIQPSDTAYADYNFRYTTYSYLLSRHWDEYDVIGNEKWLDLLKTDLDTDLTCRRPFVYKQVYAFEQIGHYQTTPEFDINGNMVYRGVYTGSYDPSILKGNSAYELSGVLVEIMFGLIFARF